MRGELAPNITVNYDDAVKPKAVVNAFFEAPPDQMEIGQCVTYGPQMNTGERFDRRTRAFRREQEVAEIADDMLLRPADLDEIRALADGVRQRRVVVELRAQFADAETLIDDFAADHARCFVSHPNAFESRRLLTFCVSAQELPLIYLTQTTGLSCGLLRADRLACRSMRLCEVIRGVTTPRRAPWVQVWVCRS